MKKEILSTIYKHLEKRIIPKDWRYNEERLRLERKIPILGENDEVEGYSWGAVVPKDIKQILKEELK